MPSARSWSISAAVSVRAGQLCPAAAPSAGSPGMARRAGWRGRPGAAGSGPRGHRRSSAGRDRGRWRWCSRGGTGRRPCRRTRLIPAGARTARMRCSPASRYRRTAGPAGPRGAVVSWAAMKSASLTSAACAGCFEMTQPSGRFHRCTCLCPSVGVRRIDQDRLRRLPVPHLPPRIPGISQDRRHRPQRPPRTRPDAGYVPGPPPTGTAPRHRSKPA